jgi:hypothetical protein
MEHYPAFLFGFVLSSRMEVLFVVWDTYVVTSVIGGQHTRKSHVILPPI